MMLNQPANPITGMDANALKQLGKYDWLYVEQTALTVLLGYQDLDDFYDVLNNVNNSIYSSDLGQNSQMLPDAWQSQSIEWFNEAGLSPQDIKKLTLIKPLSMIAP